MNFPAGYFQEEERCGFVVSEMMKRAWGAALEVLEVVDTICERNHIEYFADGGTLLGAVRHQGFIPWDDDIDICLRREDYNKLLEVLPRELPDGFVVAGMYADCERLQKACEAAHLRVIADEEYWNLPAYLGRFHGFPYPRIGIDIFPMDYVSSDEEFVKLQVEAAYMIHFTLQNWDLYVKEGILEKQLKEIERVCEVTLERNDSLKHELWLLFDKVASLTPAASCIGLTNMAFNEPVTTYGPSRLYEWMSDPIRVPFECTTIPIPRQYDGPLTAMYGDYMTLVQGTANHNYPFYKKQEAEMRHIFEQEGITNSVEEFCHNWQKMTGEV